jgi:DNA-binding transcriptional ArsR family regulator
MTRGPRVLDLLCPRCDVRLDKRLDVYVCRECGYAVNARELVEGAGPRKPQIKPLARRILRLILDLIGGDDEVSLPHNEIAQRLMVSRRAVVDAVTALREIGAVETSTTTESGVAQGTRFRVPDGDRARELIGDPTR